MQEAARRINQGTIRNHIIPKQHLYRFSSDGTLFLFDIERSRVDRRYKGISTTVNNATVQKGFYTNEYERELAKKVENDAKYVMDLLIDQAQLTIEDRTTLARYMHVYHFRTHKMKAKLEKEFRPTLQEMAQNFTRRSELLSKESVASGSRYFELLAKGAEEWLQILGAAEDISQEYLASGLGGSSLRNLEIPALLASLPWRVLVAEDGQFVLGDAFFEINALDQPVFEKYVPLDSHHCLLISRFALDREKHQVDIDRVPISARTVQAINSRIARASERFIVSAQDTGWVSRSLKTPTIRLPDIKIPQIQTTRIMRGFLRKRCPTCYSSLGTENTIPFMQELKDVEIMGETQQVTIEETYQYICSNRSCGFRTDFDAHGSRNYQMGETAKRIEENLVPNHLWNQIQSTLNVDLAEPEYLPY